jgi:hypothetical protein
MEQEPTSKPLPASVTENIQALQSYYQRQEQRAGTAQRLLERFSAAIGRPGSWVWLPFWFWAGSAGTCWLRLFTCRHSTAHRFPPCRAFSRSARC